MVISIALKFPPNHCENMIPKAIILISLKQFSFTFSKSMGSRCSHNILYISVLKVYFFYSSLYTTYFSQQTAFWRESIFRLCVFIYIGLTKKFIGPNKLFSQPNTILSLSLEYRHLLFKSLANKLKFIN